MKTPEQIADEIVLHKPFTDYQGLSNSIARAIQVERNRKIPWPTNEEIYSIIHHEDSKDSDDFTYADAKAVFKFVKNYVEKKMSES